MQALPRPVCCPLSLRHQPLKLQQHLTHHQPARHPPAPPHLLLTKTTRAVPRGPASASMRVPAPTAAVSFAQASDTRRRLSQTWPGSTGARTTLEETTHLGNCYTPVLHSMMCSWTLDGSPSELSSFSLSLPFAFAPHSRLFVSIFFRGAVTASATSARSEYKNMFTR
eukprot:m.13538 g.13538  ORF g.13538 m.13538 type:complete len:168 (-) comp3310_c0_seq1:8-511(-)